MSVPRPLSSPHLLYPAIKRGIQLLTRCIPNLACLLCAQPSRTPVCPWCEHDVPFYNHDMLPANLLHRPAIAAHARHAHYTRLYACGEYHWPFSSLIQKLKFHRKRLAATVLAEWFTAHAIADRDHPLPDCLLPVPLHIWRLSQRLYNQATELAHYIGEPLSVPVHEGWAVRRGSGSQHTRNRQARLSAARSAFCLCADQLDSQILNNQIQSVAIVDDVLTTGITVDVLAGMLKQRYPGLRIEVWVMAITPAPGRRR